MSIATKIAAGLLVTAAACTPQKGANEPGGGGDGPIAAATGGGGCNCIALAVAGEVAASIQAEVARADGLYVRGDFAGAAAAYAAAQMTSPDPELIFAQGIATWRAGDTANARASLSAYLAAGDSLAFAAQAQAALDAMDGRGGVVGDVVGGVGGVAGGAVGTVGAVGATGLGVVGGVTGAIDRPKPKKIAKGAAIVLGIVAVGAVGAVGIHGIAASAPDVDFDTKFGLGLGLSGAVVGGTAVYLWGLTATAGVVGGAPCVAAGGRF